MMEYAQICNVNRLQLSQSGTEKKLTSRSIIIVFLIKHSINRKTSQCSTVVLTLL